MEWLVVLAALACPLMMLGIAAVAWIVGKRASGRQDAGATASKEDSDQREVAISAG